MSDETRAEGRGVPPARPREKKRDPRDLVLAALIGMAMLPFTGMVHALVYRKVWNWFIAPQYGDGPSLQAWYGIGVLYGMFAVIPRAKENYAGDKPIGHMIESAFTEIVLLGIMLIVAGAARVVWGWR